jgi:hypothetical protein
VKRRTAGITVALLRWVVVVPGYALGESGHRTCSEIAHGGRFAAVPDNGSGTVEFAYRRKSRWRNASDRAGEHNESDVDQRRPSENVSDCGPWRAFRWGG